MKDITRKKWEDGSLPPYGAIYLIRFCLDHLYADKNLKSNDTLANDSLTYEELIGTLIKARVTLETMDEWLIDCEEEETGDRPSSGYFIENAEMRLEKMKFYPKEWPKHPTEVEWIERQKRKSGEKIE